MSKSYDERRFVRQRAFEYLIDDDDLTAWISEGCSGGAEVYTLPEQVEIDGKTYRLTSVEIGAFCSDQERIRELFIPDCYEYIDEDSFKINSLRIVHIGKGLQAFQPWSFTSKLETLTIHPDNPLLSVSADGKCILRKDDETMLVGVVGDPVDLLVPEGVEFVFNRAISCKERLETLTLPTTLKAISSNGIFECHALKELVIHTDKVLTANENPVDSYLFSLTPLDTFRRLIVPRHLVNEYRRHPVWGWFKRIESIEDKKRE